MNKSTIRKPRLPPDTFWMLRNMEGPGVPRSGMWLSVFGWGVEWETEPSALCPIFHEGNIRDEFHWDLYSRFTSVAAREAFISCALVEVERSPKPGSAHYVSTGRMRNHSNLPEITHWLCRDERNAWRRANKTESLRGLGKRALFLLKILDETDWLRRWAPEGNYEIPMMQRILQDWKRLAARWQNDPTAPELDSLEK